MTFPAVVHRDSVIGLRLSHHQSIALDSMKAYRNIRDAMASMATEVCVKWNASDNYGVRLKDYLHDAERATYAATRLFL